MIVDWIQKIASWIQSFWNQLDESTKRKIIDAIVKELGLLLRAFIDTGKVNPQNKVKHENI